MLRFSIREIILATVIAAVAVAWWVDTRRNRVLLSQYRNKILQADREIARRDQQIRMLDRRIQHPPKRPFNPEDWTVEELKEAVAKGVRDAAIREAR